MSNINSRITILSSILLLVLFVNLSSQQICPGPIGYDIRNLTLPDYWQFDVTGDNVCITDDSLTAPCTFFLAFCKSLPESVGTNDCTDSSFCQTSSTESITELGHFDGDDPFIGNSVNGFYADFTKSKAIINKYTNESCILNVIVEFDCDKNVLWKIPETGSVGVPPVPPGTYQSYTKDNCTIYIKFKYAGACYRIVPITTTTTTTTVTTTTTTTTTTTVTAPTPTRICIPPSNQYNISVLTFPLYWVFNIDSGCKTANDSLDRCSLNIAFCKPLETPGCEGGSACLKYPNNNKLPSLIVGNYTGNPFKSTERDGFFANFVSGATIINPITNLECELSIKMELVCDEFSIWDSPEDNSKPVQGPDPINFKSIDENSCEIKVVVPYSGACASKPGPGPDAGLSAGSVLVIVLFSLIGAYLLIGMVYNKFVDKQSGWQIIPNYNFWSAVMLAIMRGMIATWRVVTCQKKAGRNTYDSL